MVMVTIPGTGNKIEFKRICEEQYTIECYLTECEGCVAKSEDGQPLNQEQKAALAG